MRPIHWLLLAPIIVAFLTACMLIQPPQLAPTAVSGSNQSLKDTTNQPAWHPAPGTSWQIQLSGRVDVSPDVEVFDLDLFDTPQSTIDKLHSQDRKVICYFSAGSWEDWRADAADFPPEILGKGLEGWPGEQWLDIRRIDLLTPLMQARLDLAYQKRCDGVDPDNMDGYQNDSGFDLASSDQLAYNIWIAEQAHARGLAVGLKNDLGQIPELVKHYDWALNEECFQYNECDQLLAFIQSGKPVFGIEYQGDPADFCPQANALNFDFLKKRLELDAWQQACR
jgi:hypothetical protein